MSMKFNSSHNNQLILRALHADVMSDEFFTKIISLCHTFMFGFHPCLQSEIILKHNADSEFAVYGICSNKAFIAVYISWCSVKYIF